MLIHLSLLKSTRDSQISMLRAAMTRRASELNYLGYTGTVTLAHIDPDTVEVRPVLSEHDIEMIYQTPQYKIMMAGKTPARLPTQADIKSIFSGN